MTGARNSIRTARLLLRPIAPEDREEYVRVQRVSAEHFADWFPVRVGEPEEWFEEEMEKSRRGWLGGTHARFVGEVEDGRIVGFFNLNEIVRGSFHCAYAGWSVSADATGRGYATEGVTGLLDFAFAEEGLGLHRVQANIIPRNKASQRVAEKVGMRREGRAERYLKIAGVWRDHLMYAKTAEEHAFVYL